MGTVPRLAGCETVTLTTEPNWAVNKNHLSGVICSLYNTKLSVVGVQMRFDQRLLLTGTPVQNNLVELYSLLSFIAPTIFRYRYVDEFVSTYSELSNTSSAPNGLFIGFLSTVVFPCSVDNLDLIYLVWSSFSFFVGYLFCKLVSVLHQF